MDCSWFVGCVCVSTDDFWYFVWLLCFVLHFSFCSVSSRVCTYFVFGALPLCMRVWVCVLWRAWACMVNGRRIIIYGADVVNESGKYVYMVYIYTYMCQTVVLLYGDCASDAKLKIAKKYLKYTQKSTLWLQIFRFSLRKKSKPNETIWNEKWFFVIYLTAKEKQRINDTAPVKNVKHKK